MKYDTYPSWNTSDDERESDVGSIWCLFCLKKSRKCGRQSTVEILKEEGLFHFLCNYLQLVPENYWDLVKQEEGTILPVCTKCTRSYRELSKLHAQFQKLEIEIKTVVSEFQRFVILSTTVGDLHNNDKRGGCSDFHKQFRKDAFQAFQQEHGSTRPGQQVQGIFDPGVEVRIKEEITDEDDVTINVELEDAEDGGLMKVEFEEAEDDASVTPEIPNKPSKRHSRQKTDINHKLEIVAYAKATSQNKAFKRYGVDRKLIRKWTKEEPDLIEKQAEEAKIRGVVDPGLQVRIKEETAEDDDLLKVKLEEAEEDGGLLNAELQDAEDADLITMSEDDHSGTPEMPIKRKISRTINNKLEIVAFAKLNSLSEAAKLFGADRKLIRDWIKNETDLKKLADDTKSTCLCVICLGSTATTSPNKTKDRRAGGGRKLLYSNVDEPLKEWILSENLRGRKIIRRAAVKKAHQIYRENPENSLKKYCKIDDAWLGRFLKRHEISSLNPTSIKAANNRTSTNLERNLSLSTTPPPRSS